NAKYIGRVGALAIALGVGAAIAAAPGVAWAETDKKSSGTASAGCSPEPVESADDKAAERDDQTKADESMTDADDTGKHRRRA
ncbi:hypothetical protein C6A85_12160, partial [Mycobacterium sp. ITM-2017-0098]